MGSCWPKPKNKENPKKKEINGRATEISKNLEKNGEISNDKTNNTINNNTTTNNIKNLERSNEINGGNYKASENSKNLEKNGKIINDKTNNTINKNNTNTNNDKNLERSNEINGGNYKASEITKAQKEEVKIALPHNYEAILKDADSPIDKSSPEKIYEQLYGGVFLNRKKKKYWVDKKTNKNCFMLFPRDLSIAWSDDDKYWTWSQLKETSTSDVTIDVAELIIVYWLDINGKFDTKKLSPGTVYEVVYVVRLTNDCSGWHVPVNLRLILPDGNKREKTEILKEKPIDEWIEIKVGEFTSMPEKGGNVEFFFYENVIQGPKCGLIVKGVIIRPKSN